MALGVGLLGARGHVGAELVRLIGNHPRLRWAALGSRALDGQRPAELPASHPAVAYEALDPEAAAARAVDVWVLGLPNGESRPYVDKLAHRDALLVDLSADHRFDTAWVYGLPELGRAKLAGARRVANPGCYATGAQLGAAPLVDLCDGPIHAFGVSGYSGAGTTPSPRNDPEVLRDNLLPYSLADHLHEREASRHLGHPVRLLPHVAGFFRGISLTLSATLGEATSADRLRERIAARYAAEPLVSVVDETPRLRDSVGSHRATIGGVAVTADGRQAALVVTLDNLLKGAATQALQNINLACGFAEREGIPE